MERVFSQPWAKCTFPPWEGVEMRGGAFQRTYLGELSSRRASSFYPAPCDHPITQLTTLSTRLSPSSLSEQCDFRSTLNHLYTLQYPSQWASLVAQPVKNQPAMQGQPGSIPGWGRFPWRRDRLSTPVFMGFPGGSDNIESTYNVRDLGSIPRLGRSPGGGHGNPLQYSCLKNPQDRRA